MMVKGDYSSDVTMKLSVWQKDMNAIAEFAKANGCPTPLFSPPRRSTSPPRHRSHRRYRRRVRRHREAGELPAQKNAAVAGFRGSKGAVGSGSLGSLLHACSARGVRQRRRAADILVVEPGSVVQQTTQRTRVSATLGRLRPVASAGRVIQSLQVRAAT
jgi:ribosomal protein S30